MKEIVKLFVYGIVGALAIVGAGEVIAVFDDDTENFNHYVDETIELINKRG